MICVFMKINFFCNFFLYLFDGIAERYFTFLGFHGRLLIVCLPNQLTVVAHQAFEENDRKLTNLWFQWFQHFSLLPCLASGCPAIGVRVYR
jgi:hypothetical protein